MCKQYNLRRVTFSITALLLLLFPAKALADAELNTTVTFDVDDTVLEISGRTVPNGFVTILDGQSVIGNTSADSSGNFSKSFSAQTPGLHTISAYAKDLDSGLTTDTITQTVSLQAQAQTSLELFLPPTITLSSSSITVGDLITFSGRTIPGGTVVLLIDNNLTLQTTANADGEWQINADTDGYYIGTHSAYVVTKDGGGTQSSPSQKRLFMVESAAPGDKDEQIVPDDREPVQTPISIPTFTFPTDGQHFSESPIVIRGNGTPNSQIELYDGDKLIGSTFVNADGEWSISLDLTKDTYTLRIRSCINSRCSGFSDFITIYYGGAAFPAAGFELELSQYRFARIRPKQNLVLGIKLIGGDSPYKVTIDWGDGSIENFTIHNKTTTFDHRYKTTGHYNGIVTVQDKNNTYRLRFFSVNVEQSTRKVNFWLYIIIFTIISTLYLLFKRSNEKLEISKKRD